jgi:hypothetical protein
MGDPNMVDKELLQKFLIFLEPKLTEFANASDMSAHDISNLLALFSINTLVRIYEASHNNIYAPDYSNLYNVIKEIKKVLEIQE